MSLKHSAQQTLAILESGAYLAPSGTAVSIGPEQRTAAQGTVLYTPEQVAGLLARSGHGAAAQVVVTDETTQAAARRLVVDEGRDIVLLNFASARNVGGGFLNGARAQEEDLCRCSGLYPCLRTQMTYYTANRAQRSLLYTDHMIYSPSVPFFQIRSRGAYLERPFTASVITAPAPNAGPMLRRNPGAGPIIAETFRRRWGNVLAVARDRGHRTVLLGAWGCGAFGNSPEVASDALRYWLSVGHFDGDFDLLVLAIPSTSKHSRRNLLAFQIQLG